jgi:tRNA G18 (ribose-2'-O)-methylase SpoU
VPWLIVSTNKQIAMIKSITDIDDPRVQVFSRLTEAQLRNRLDPSRGVFIAESPKVIRVALDAGYRPLSLLCEEKHIVGDAKDIVARLQEQQVDIYTGSRELLAGLTGYTLTRGVLCAMHRPAESTLEQVLANAHRVVVIDGVVDATNIGAIFRSAAALGMDAVLVTRSSCDPWNRRAIRVSMGSVFLVPWAWLDDYSQLRNLGFATCAMALEDRSIGIDDPILHAQDRLAIIMGTEGEGLPNETIKAADFVVKIPMAHGVDSLNVAAAASVAFWELRKRS